jgi:hypothetical protein
MRREWLVALTGVAFVVLVIVAVIVMGEPPSADDPVQDIVDHYVDNKDSVQIGGFLSALAGVLLIFFANYLRNVCERVRPTPTSLTIVVGAAIIATGIAIDSTIGFALADKADKVDPVAVQSLQTLWDNDFLPLAVGTIVFLVSAGVAVLQTGILPRWLGWVVLALAVVGVTPIGWVAILAGGVWILVASVMLSLRARAGATPASPPPPVAP